MSSPAAWLAWAPRAGARPARGIFHLHRSTIVPAPLAQTFAFFSDASNLERLTPPWLNFHIQTPQPIATHAGAIIDYRLTLYGLPILWQTRIDVWEPGVRFVDCQVRGPYLWWHHEHRFEEVAGGTRVIDHVEMVPRMRWLTGLLVRRDVTRIFDFREQTLKKHFPA